VAAPGAVNPAVLQQGMKETGKLYFDVVGQEPDSIVFSSPTEDIVIFKG
jgi:hypothetical protein